MKIASASGAAGCRAPLALVIGGAASGKSEIAERLCVKLAAGAPCVYLATMENASPEAAARIERHRAQRAGRSFATVERSRALAGVADALPLGCAVLLEDVGNLVAGELFSPGATETSAISACREGIEAIRRRASVVVAVTVSVGDDGASHEAGTQAYLRVLSQVNAYLAREADEVAEAVCGIAVACKGGKL